MNGNSDALNSRSGTRESSDDERQTLEVCRDFGARKSLDFRYGCGDALNWRPRRANVT
jgi:hypothetical protein